MRASCCDGGVCVVIDVRGSCRIGTEHEKFGFQLGTLQPMTYDQIRLLLEGMSERFEWERVMEGDNIIGLTFVRCSTLL